MIHLASTYMAFLDENRVAFFKFYMLHTPFLLSNNPLPFVLSIPFMFTCSVSRCSELFEPLKKFISRPRIPVKYKKVVPQLHHADIKFYNTRCNIITHFNASRCVSFLAPPPCITCIWSLDKNKPRFRNYEPIPNLGMVAV